MNPRTLAAVESKTVPPQSGRFRLHIETYGDSQDPVVRLLNRLKQSMPPLFDDMDRGRCAAQQFVLDTEVLTKDKVYGFIVLFDAQNGGIIQGETLGGKK